jgi:uncharacterized DUF497 family protein
MMRYEWDQAKNRSNFVKHGLDLEDTGRVLVIAHAPRGPATRIISMRKANRREQEIYYKRLEES